jgi:hypothetical protein
MLLESALLQGNEQRGRTRVAVGYEVSYRSGPVTYPATLIDLSPGGCRLLSSNSVSEDARIAVQFPAEISGGEAFEHEGVVTRTRPASLEGGESCEVSIGVRFAKFGSRTCDRMLAMLNGLSTGPATLVHSTEPRKPEWSVQREPRVVFEAEVPAFGLENCVLVGRDLSRGGIRVERHPLLRLGTELRLALAGQDEPIVVTAEVVRDDERGTALRFHELDPAFQQRLDALVRSLPAIESLTPDEVRAEKIVPTQLVPTLERRSRP